MPIGVFPIEPVDVKTAPPISVGDITFKTGVAASGVVYNVPVTLADTEQSFSFPDHTKAFEIRPRNSGQLKVAFTSGASGTNYVEVARGASYEKNLLDTTGLIVYFQTSNVPEVVQIVVYS